MKTTKLVVLVIAIGAAIILFTYRPLRRPNTAAPDSHATAKSSHGADSSRDEKPEATIPTQENAVANTKSLSSSPPDIVYKLPAFATREEEKRFFANYAFKVIAGTIEIPNRYDCEVEAEGDNIVVTFLIDGRGKNSKVPPPYPGPSFRALVKFNKMTGKVVVFMRGS